MVEQDGLVEYGCRVEHGGRVTRRGRHALVAALLALLLATAADPAAAQHMRAIPFQDVAREVIVSNAEAARTGPKPLLVILHGRRQPDEKHRSSAGLDALAVREGIVVAYPAGREGRWNVPHATLGTASKAGAEPTDDLGFLGHVIDTLVAEKLADPRRIYVSGASNGAMMALALACARADRIAAAAALIASMTDTQMAACKPARPVPLVVIAGTDDTILPYDGWLHGDFRFTSVPETLEYWRRLHGCTGQNGTYLPRKQDGETTRTWLIDWTGCRNDGALRLYRVQGGGHTLPTLRPLPPGDERRLGRRSADFETSEEVWRFLARWQL